MAQKSITSISLKDMNQLFDSNSNHFKTQSYVGKDFIIVNDIGQEFKYNTLFGTPLRMEDTRMGLIKEGEAELMVNLSDLKLTKNTLLYISKGSIVQFKKISDDFKIAGFVLNDNLLYLSLNGRMPRTLNAPLKVCHCPLNEAELNIFNELFRTLWLISNQHLKTVEIISGQVQSMLYFIDEVNSKHLEQEVVEQSGSRAIFEKFLQLVNINNKKEHQLPFYAHRLFLTPRYLSTTVKQVSGITAKEWIDRSLITEAKILLKYSNLRSAQISYELNFPNPSFFSKYFKRLTGMTPEDYRLS